jgi:hypothetical protein
MNDEGITLPREADGLNKIIVQLSMCDRFFSLPICVKKCMDGIEVPCGSHSATNIVK